MEEKNKWDPDYAKRKAIKGILDPLIPDFSVRLGGATSIDVTKPGIDKAYGIGKLRDLLGIPIKEMIYGSTITPDPSERCTCSGIWPGTPKKRRKIGSSSKGLRSCTVLAA